MQASSQAVETMLQHGGVLETQTLPIGQSVSAVQPCCGGGVAQYVAHAEETLDGFDVQVYATDGQSLAVRHCEPDSGWTPGQIDPVPEAPPFAPPAPRPAAPPDPAPPPPLVPPDPEPDAPSLPSVPAEPPVPGLLPAPPVPLPPPPVPVLTLPPPLEQASATNAHADRRQISDSLFIRSSPTNKTNSIRPQAASPPLWSARTRTGDCGQYTGRRLDLTPGLVRECQLRAFFDGTDDHRSDVRRAVDRVLTAGQGQSARRTPKTSMRSDAGVRDPPRKAEGANGPSGDRT